jgi:hypothetical protein
MDFNVRVTRGNVTEEANFVTISLNISVTAGGSEVFSFEHPVRCPKGKNFGHALKSALPEIQSITNELKKRQLLYESEEMKNALAYLNEKLNG